MKYAVIGLGAVGSIIGGYLAKTNENVVFVVKKNQVETIKKQGFIIDGNKITSDYIQVTDEFSALSDADVVFICVKAQDTEPVAHMIEKDLSKTAVLISLQNGVHNAQVLEEITKIKTLSGVVLFNAVYNTPGDATLTMKGGLLIEQNKERHAELSMMQKHFKTAGLKVQFVKDINAVLWSKLILNTQNAITALTGQTILESVKNRDSRVMIIATMKEARDIVKNAGVKLSTLPGVDPRRMILILRVFGGFSATLSAVFLKVKPEARNSMWQSLSRGKTTEIEYINGEIVRLAEQQKRKAPVNRKLVEMVKKVEEHLLEKREPKALRALLKL